MTKPMLVILSPGFAADETDSTCLPFQQALVKTIKEKFPNLEVVVIAFQYPFLSSTYQWNNTTVISLNGRNKKKFYKLWVWNKAWRCLKRFHRQHRIVGILSFWYNECAFIGHYFAMMYSLKHYCWIMGQDARPGNKFVKYATLKGHQIIALSDFLQIEFQKNYGIKPCMIIPPGVKDTLLPSGTRPIDLLGVGSLITLKQFDLFVDIVSEIRKQLPEVKAVLVGDGPEKKRLSDKVAESAAKDNIAITGALPNNEVLALMRKTKILLHTSSYEGFGVVCLEALSAGAHVISFVRPMNEKIEQWHIVKNREEMLQKAIEILNSRSTTFNNITFQSIEETAQKVGALFLEGT